MKLTYKVRNLKSKSVSQCYSCSNCTKESEFKIFSIHLCGEKNYCDCESSPEHMANDDLLVDWQSLTSNDNMKQETLLTTFFLIADFEKKILNRLYNKNSADVLKKILLFNKFNIFMTLTKYIKRITSSIQVVILS